MRGFKSLIILPFIIGSFIAQAQAPSWNVNPNRYQYSMTITAVLDLNCTELTNPSNQLGAFVGDSLRGSALSSNVIGGRYQVNMTIYSDSVNNEMVYFKFYHQGTDSIYQSIDSIAFQDNAIYGSPANPVVLRNNHRPSLLMLSNDTLTENQTNPTTLGSLSTMDADASQTHTYSLVAGNGDTDNARFSIVGNSLIVNFVADFEAKNTYNIRLRSTDNEGCSLDSAYTIYIKDSNDAPTAIQLSANNIDENNLPNAVIGTLSAVDGDAGETFTYALIAGAGGADNGAFNISGADLRADSSFNFEAKNQYSIKVQVTDAGNNTFVDTFKIDVNDINDAPTDILINADSVLENKPTNTIITSLMAVDEDAGQSYSFSFDNVAGNDNANFNIVGSSLRTKASFDYETTDLYFLYIKVDDLNGGTYTKQISIRVINANDLPSDIQLTTNSVNENMPIGSFVANIQTTDQDTGAVFTYTLVNGVGDADNANFQIRNDSLLTASVLNLNAQSSHEIRIQTNDGSGTFSKSFTLIVKDINDIPTNITLSNNIIAENMAVGSEVGVFTTADADAGDNHSYSFVSGNGDSNNVAFNISSNKLLTNRTFNVNVQDTFSIRVQTDDGFGGVFQKQFIITIANSNDAPTDILLSNDSIFESMPPNTRIGNFTSVDPDSADTHSYSFVNGANDNASFALVGNELRSATSFNFEGKSSYFITVESSDGKGGTFAKQFNISIKDTTDGPSDILLDNNLVAENLASGSFIGQLSSIDEDATDSFTYSLVSGVNSTDNSAFQISNDSLLTVSTFDYEARSTYNIRVRTTDASNLFTEKAFTIRITNANDAPTDISLTNNTVSEDATLNTTVGIFTTLDPDTGNTHSYSLVAGVGDADNDDFKISGNALKTDTLFDVNVRTSYSVRIRTTDAQGLSFEKVFTITITNANDAPTDISLSPASVNENLPPNTLVGNFASVDPDINDSHIYTFANLSANDNASFAIVGTELRTSASFDFETKSVYFIQIQSSDGNGGTYSRQLFVNVNDTNDNPTDLILSRNSIDEKQAIGEFLGRLSSVDQDATDTYTYSLVNGNGDDDNSGFTISNDSVFSNATFDVLVKSQLSIRVRTSDKDNKFYEKAFSIFVQNVNDAPTDINLSNSSVAENTPINSTVGLFSTNDIDPMQSFSYQLVSGSGDADNGNFVISGNELKSNVNFDYNTQRKHNIRIRSTDQGGLFFEKQFTVNISNSNDAPTNIVLTPANFKENLPLNTSIGTFSSVDKDSTDTFSYAFVNQGSNDNTAFIISGNELKTGQNFDFENKSLYVIEVQSSDQAGATFSRQLTVNVLDSNDAPTSLSISADSVLERSPIGTYVADLSTSDEDATDQFTYSLVAGQGSADNALFRINGNLLEVDSVLAFNNGKKRFVRIRSSDQGGLSVEAAFVINIKNVNDAPTAILLSDTMISENAAAGSRLATLTTLDEDRNDSFTYELVDGLGGADNSSFLIVGNELQNMINFDFETQATFQIRIKSTDAAGASIERAFTIYLENGNEAPSIQEQTFAIQENLTSASVIGQLSATDPDLGDELSFRLLDNQLYFSISSEGSLVSNQEFDYESKSLYMVRVEVSDLVGLTDTAEVVIQIIDQIENNLPTAAYFSPNGDGKNDSWYIENVELYSNYRLTIFSASGSLVYEKSANYNNDWDGSIGGEALPEGIYYYYFEDSRDAANHFKGTITLKR